MYTKYQEMLRIKTERNFWKQPLKNQSWYEREQWIKGRWHFPSPGIWGTMKYHLECIEGQKLSLKNFTFDNYTLQK